MAGGAATMNYGPEYVVHRGASYEFKSGNNQPWAYAGAAVVSLLGAGAQIGAAYATKDNVCSARIAQVGATGVTGLAIGILNGIELKFGIAHAAADKLEEAEQLIYVATAVKPALAKDLCAAAERRVADSLKQVNQAIDAVKSAAALGEKRYSGPYRVTADDLTLRAAPSVGALFTDSTVNVEAFGDGTNGTLKMTGTGQATLNSGPATVQLSNTDQTVGTITLDCGELGTLTLRQGPPLEGPTIQLSLQQIKLSVGPPDVGAQITMTPESIVFSVGPPDTGAAIGLTPDGILLQYLGIFMVNLAASGVSRQAAENTDELNPEGRVVEVTNDELSIVVAHVVNAAASNQEYSGETQAIVPFTNWQ